jgi:hypothetical protein
MKPERIAGGCAPQIPPTPRASLTPRWSRGPGWPRRAGSGRPGAPLAIRPPDAA